MTKKLHQVQYSTTCFTEGGPIIFILFLKQIHKITILMLQRLILREEMSKSQKQEHYTQTWLEHIQTPVDPSCLVCFLLLKLRFELQPTTEIDTKN